MVACNLEDRLSTALGDYFVALAPLSWVRNEKKELSAAMLDHKILYSSMAQGGKKNPRTCLSLDHIILIVSWVFIELLR
jgi:hypothetical protein